MSLKKALLAATMLALPVAAQAQQQPHQVRGIYVGAGFGWNWASDSDVTTNFPAASGRSGSGTASFNPGFAIVGNVGWGFGNGLRTEFEVNYRDNNLSNMNVSNVGFGPLYFNSGSTYSYGLMVNALYDFQMGWPVVPYVGVGVGAVIQNWDNVRQARQTNSTNYLHIVGTNTNFAYQGILGVAIPVGDSPSLAFTVEYRAVGVLDGDRNAYYYTGSGGPRISGSADTTNSLNQSLMFGVRYNFGQRRAPEPPPAVAPAPARTFLVFFDWDRFNLTDRARQIIAEAAQAAQRTGTTRIEVAGHADRSGTPQYNMGLSQRRADAVATELARLGVPRTAMVIQAFGETRPLVPTADGVREPQNRRVEIVLR